MGGTGATRARDRPLTMGGRLAFRNVPCACVRPAFHGSKVRECSKASVIGLAQECQLGCWEFSGPPSLAIVDRPKAKPDILKGPCCLGLSSRGLRRAFAFAAQSTRMIPIWNWHCLNPCLWLAWLVPHHPQLHLRHVPFPSSLEAGAACQFARRSHGDAVASPFQRLYSLSCRTTRLS